MSSVSVYSYTHSVTYVTDNILKSFREIIRLSGLSPAKFVDNWQDYHRAINAWLSSEHLLQVILEIYHPRTNALIKRWDIDIAYEWSSGDGSFYADVEQLRYAIRKSGIAPSEAEYSMTLVHKPGAPSVHNWGAGSLRSTAGMTRQSLGSTVDHNGLGASAAYWR
jgi:hypothetical protein